jgi:hypothetical protein
VESITIAGRPVRSVNSRRRRRLHQPIKTSISLMVDYEKQKQQLTLVPHLLVAITNREPALDKKNYMFGNYPKSIKSIKGTNISKLLFKLFCPL